MDITTVANLDLDKILPNLDKQNRLGKPIIRNRVYRIGIELEGGWVKLPDPGMVLVPDGSIRNIKATAVPVQPQVGQAAAPLLPARPAVFRTRREQEVYNAQVRMYEQAMLVQMAGNQYPSPAQPSLHIGEYPSEILEPTKYPAWMRKYYPTHVNETCGMHVHMSFQRALHYSRLMIPEFPQTIVAYITKWALEEKLPEAHPIWDRLRGKSEYCKFDFFPDDQAKQSRKIYEHSGKGHRYTVINYCHAKTATLECRLLPMMDTAEQAIRAVKRVIDITNACLYVLKSREPKENASLVIDNVTERLEERSRIYV